MRADAVAVESDRKASECALWDAGAWLERNGLDHADCSDLAVALPHRWKHGFLNDYRIVVRAVRASITWALRALIAASNARKTPQRRACFDRAPTAIEFLAKRVFGTPIHFEVED